MIVPTKLTIPQARGALIDRPRLMNKLDDGLAAKLTFVSAHAGYGKSTALSQWARAAGMPVAWVSLDPRDNDWVQFWSYVAAAVGTAYPGFESAATSLIKDGPSSSSDHRLSSEPAIKMLLSELHGLSGKLTLVLDDYQFIQLSAIHRSFAYFVEHLPVNIHLCIASRSELPIPTARLLAKGELHLVTADDLRFGLDEGLDYFASKPELAVTREQGVELLRQTEGWISGLQLASISLRRSTDRAAFIRQFRGRQHRIADYLLEEVLHDLEEPLRAFLLETSVLTRMNRALCDAVTGRSDGQEQLTRLEQLNLFLIPLDEERQWYRYHHLLSDYLRHAFSEEDPDGWVAAHAKAGHWLEDEGYILEAAEHYWEGRQYEAVVRLIERNLQTLIRLNMQALGRWLLQLPEELVRSSPSVEMFYLLVLIGSGQWSLASAKIDDARVRYEALQDSMDGTQWKSLMGNVYFLSASAAYLRKDLIAMSAYFEIADRMFPEGKALRTVGYNDTAGSAVFKDHLGFINDHNGAAEFLKKWIGNWSANKMHPTVGSLYASYAKLLYERNRLEEADSYIMEVLGPGKEPPVAAILEQIYVGASRIQQAIGRRIEAAELLEQLKLRIASSNYDLYIGGIDAELADLSVRQGSLAYAGEWLARCDLSAEDTMTPHNAGDYLAYARVLSACGRPEEALAVADKLQAMLLKEDRHRDRIRALIVQSGALHRLGRTVDAITRLDKALRLAEPQGYVRSFVDEGPIMAELLEAYAAARGSERGEAVGMVDYAGRLLQALRAEMSDGDQVKKSPVARAKVSCFGRFKVLGGTDGTQESKWRTAKAEELMAYLLHHRGEAVDRYRILDALWGNDAEKTASYFNTTVHYLKKNLRGIGIDVKLHYNRGCYRLDLSAFDCDYIAFYRQLSAAGDAVNDNTIAQWETTAKLYAGSYLEGNDYAWAEQARISIENDYVFLAQNIADYYKSAGEYEAAIATLKRAVKLVSWSEDLHVRLIKAYLANDDRAAALKQYDAMAAMLRTEYQMEPGEDLRRILQIG
ncbi:BTAD domain-containing putative transcriptional regulator [Cohnella sp. GCM10027633]|uniref:BTAD domain-containing putative transcriptional regulator n=1 Tax=unclassified Cohnella TaxID=2636738 RepID=UPI00362DF47F